MSDQKFDVIVIGAGPGGYVAAIRAVQLGLSVAIVERENLGGICLNWGCIPTKAMLRSAEVFSQLKRANEYGLSAGKVGFDLNAIVKRSREVAQKLNGGVGFLMKKNKIKVLMGEARFLSTDQLAVTSDKGEIKISAPEIIVATGARARELEGMEADGDQIWTYRHALMPPRMPKTLLVIGSGAIGIEFASFYNTFGAKTTVVELLERILPVEDEEISAAAKKEFERQGMTIMEKSAVSSLKQKDKVVSATIAQDGNEIVKTFDTVISATGIVGNTEGLGLEEVGVTTDRGHIVVDEFCRTKVKSISAIGDVAGPPWLAHKASHEGIAVAERLAGMTPHAVRADQIAGCTYCHPQIASVGMTESAAKSANKNITVGRFPLSANGKAIALGETGGFIKTVFDQATGELLGAHMIGAEVTELIQGYIVGRQLETTELDLMGAVFPHPTISEAMHESVLDAYNRVVHA